MSFFSSFYGSSLDHGCIVPKVQEHVSPCRFALHVDKQTDAEGEYVITKPRIDCLTNNFLIRLTSLTFMVPSYMGLSLTG